MIQAIIDRLKAQTSIGDILPAEDLEAIGNGTAPRNKTVFVIPFREVGQPNRYSSGTFRQSIETYIIVAFLVRHYDDAKGGKRSTGFDEMRSEIENALIGWAWDESEDPFELVSGQGSPFGKSATIYAQTWKTSRTLEQTP